MELRNVLYFLALSESTIIFASVEPWLFAALLVTVPRLEQKRKFWEGR